MVAVVEQVFKGLVAGNFLVHQVGFDELEEGFPRDVIALDGVLEGDHYRVAGSPFVAAFQVLPPLLQEGAAVALRLVTKVVHSAAVGVEVGHVLTLGLGQQ